MYACVSFVFGLVLVSQRRNPGVINLLRWQPTMLCIGPCGRYPVSSMKFAASVHASVLFADAILSSSFSVLTLHDVVSILPLVPTPHRGYGSSNHRAAVAVYFGSQYTLFVSSVCAGVCAAAYYLRAGCKFLHSRGQAALFSPSEDCRAGAGRFFPVCECPVFYLPSFERDLLSTHMHMSVCLVWFFGCCYGLC